MGLTVASYKTGAVNGKQHRKILDADIMEHLIVASLEKGGVDRYHRLEAGCCHARSRGDCVGFGDPHIKKAFRIFCCKF